MRSVPEKDWKVFKMMHPVALDRFSKRVLDEAQALLNDKSKTTHETYLALYSLIQRRNKKWPRSSTITDARPRSCKFR